MVLAESLRRPMGGVRWANFWSGGGMQSRGWIGLAYREMGDRSRGSERQGWSLYWPSAGGQQQTGGRSSTARLDDLGGYEAASAGS